MTTLEQFGLGMLVSLLLVVVCVLIHYEGLNLLEKLSLVERHWLRRHRPRMVLVMIGVVGLHLLEIFVFAFAYVAMELSQMPGDIVPMAGVVAEHGVLDYVYYSSVVYTSLGMGDWVPVGVYKMVSGTQTLLGLILIGWSASFTYLLMLRQWGRSG